MIRGLRLKIHWMVFVCFLFAGNSGDSSTFQCRNPPSLLWEQPDSFLSTPNNVSFREKVMALRGGFHDKKTSPMRQTPRSVVADADPVKSTGTGAEQVRFDHFRTPPFTKRRTIQRAPHPFHRGAHRHPMPCLVVPNPKSTPRHPPSRIRRSCSPRTTPPPWPSTPRSG